MKNLYFLIILLISLSCKQQTENDSEKYYDKFPKNIEITHSSIPVDIDVKFNLIALYDSFLIVRDYTNLEYVFRIYNKNTFKFVKYCVKKGDGPNEISMIGQWEIDKKNGLLWINDANKLIYLRFNIDSVIKQTTYRSEIKASIDSEYYPVDNFCPIDSNILLFSGQYGSELLGKLNTSQKLHSFIGKKPYLNKNFPAPIYSIIYSLKIAPKPTMDKIAINFRYFNRFIIYDLSTNKQLDIYGPDINKSIEFNNQLQIDKVNMAYYTVKADNNYIYCLYNGKKLFERNDHSMSSNFPKKIQVFDWDGNPKAEINLDLSIVDFVIDEETNRIIVSTPDTENPIAYYNFNLKSI